MNVRDARTDVLEFALLARLGLLLGGQCYSNVYLAPRCEPGVSSPRPDSRARSNLVSGRTASAPGSRPYGQPTREYTENRAPGSMVFEGHPLLGPHFERAHRRLEFVPGARQFVSDPDRRTGVDVAPHDARGLEFAQAFGEQPIGNTRNAGKKFVKAPGARDQRTNDGACPAFPD